MTFAWPHVLWLLVLPVALLAWDLSRRRRAAEAGTHPKILRAEIGAHDLSLARDTARNGPSRVRPWLAAGLAFAIAALARPQWGRIEEPVFQQSREILLAVDLSRSMLSTDVEPSRLDRAKLLIQALLEKLRGERVGLEVFSGTAFLQSPLSSDYEILREFLPALNPNYLPEGGTNYRALLETAIHAFGGGSDADRFLIILSDGEATDEHWKALIPELKQKHIRVIGLGVGTAAGSMIPDGAGGFVKDDRGAVVLSKLESGTLQELARATGGTYRDASTWVDLASLINETVNRGKKGSFVDKRTIRLVERFQWPLALALWCLLVSLYYEFPVRPRPRDIALRGRPPAKPAGPAAPTPGAPGGTASLIGLLLASAFLLGRPARAAVRIAPPQPSATPAPATPAPSTVLPPMGPPASPPSAAAPKPPSPATTLARIVARLSNASHRTALDWAELARQTVAWGSQLKSAHEPVPEGPVRDALAAVDRGSRLDPNATDWPGLKRQLQNLLRKPKPPPQQKKQSKPRQNQNQKGRQPPKQNQKGSGKQPQNQGGSQQQGQQPPKPPQQNGAQKNQPSPSKPPSSPQKSGNNESGNRSPQSGKSAFGNLKSPPPPARQSGEMQKVGGTRENRNQAQPADPALALPLQKLDQLRHEDSPAKLFELMDADRSEGNRKQPAKNW